MLSSTFAGRGAFLASDVVVWEVVHDAYSQELGAADSLNRRTVNYQGVMVG